MLSDDTHHLLRRTEAVEWLGVYARDQLPRDLLTRRGSRPFSLVLNTHPGSMPGDHWLALYAPRTGALELFHSYALAPTFYGLD